MECVFCTLFDSNYLDKGLTLYHSMEKVLKDFRLYVFAFDDLCYSILKKENLNNLIPISLQEVETDELRNVKKERTRAEYCWTCSPWVIKYVLEQYRESICTYIDADMQFFSSPQPVFDDLYETQSSVLIFPHRFRTKQEEQKAHDSVGSYCVEFNTFKNDEYGKRALDWWAAKCLEWCFYAVPGTTEWYGDQKYLNVFPEKFDGVKICNHFGVGLAPWNVCLVEYAGDNDGVPQIRVIDTGEVFQLVIYHFENVSFLTHHILHASSRIESNELYRSIYKPYIMSLLKNRKYIEEKYDIHLSRSRRVVTNNPLMKIYQKYISPFRRVKYLRDLYWVK